MVKLERYIPRFDNYIKNFERTLFKIVKKDEKFILKVLQNRLEFQNIDGDEKPLGTYSERHKKFRDKLGLTTSGVTLNLFGGFYKGMYIDIERGVLVIDSRDYKTLLLVDGENGSPGYGDAILELTEGEQEEWIEQRIEPALLEIIINFGEEIIF